MSSNFFFFLCLLAKMNIGCIEKTISIFDNNNNIFGDLKQNQNLTKHDNDDDQLRMYWKIGLFCFGNDQERERI